MKRSIQLIWNTWILAWIVFSEYDVGQCLWLMCKTHRASGLLTNGLSWKRKYLPRQIYLTKKLNLEIAAVQIYPIKTLIGESFLLLPVFFSVKFPESIHESITCITTLVLSNYFFVSSKIIGKGEEIVHFYTSGIIRDEKYFKNCRCCPMSLF